MPSAIELPVGYLSFLSVLSDEPKVSNVVEIALDNTSRIIEISENDEDSEYKSNVSQAIEKSPVNLRFSACIETPTFIIEPFF